MARILYKSRWVFLAVLVVALGTVPIWGTEYHLLFFLLFCLYLAMSQMWNLLVGYSGLLSLGQQSFIGLGGYTVAVMTNYYGICQGRATIRRRAEVDRTGHVPVARGTAAEHRDLRRRLERVAIVSVSSERAQRVPRINHRRTPLGTVRLEKVVGSVNRAV